MLEVRITQLGDLLVFTTLKASVLHYGKYDPPMREHVHQEVILILRKALEVKTSKDCKAAISSVLRPPTHIDADLMTRTKS